ncbi:MAG: hypothetical protein K9K67_07000 [Bacteriovoracaceae bacterium]|nr:hypothetical protein [Bacteriovoracaceae bacterium]
MRAYLSTFIFCLLTFQFSIISSYAGTADLKVLTVKNSDEGSFFDLYIKADEELRAVGLKMYDRDDKDWKDFDVKNLQKGVILKEEGEHKVIVLKSNDFEDDRGGHFKVDYLHNGITGKREDIDIKFDFDGTSWRIFHNGQEVSLLDFKLKKFFGKTIGIEEVIAR